MVILISYNHYLTLCKKHNAKCHNNAINFVLAALGLGLNYVGTCIALAVLLCRLFVTCAGIPARVLDKGVCSTAVAVASLVALLTVKLHL